MCENDYRVKKECVYKYNVYKQILFNPALPWDVKCIAFSLLALI